MRLLPLVALLILAGCGTDAPDERVVQREIPFEPAAVVEFTHPDGRLAARIAAEIAEGDSAQVRGLMDRRSLPAKGGMIFPYDDAEVRRFWMKNTPLSLDIIFVGPDSKVVSIARGTTPFSEAFVTSAGPAQHVVEVRAGFTAQYGIDTTTTVSWRPHDFSNAGG